MNNPIWRDYFINLGAVESLEYSVKINSAEVFAGLAQRRPSDSDLLVCLNDLAADYLSTSMPDISAQAFVNDNNMSTIVQVYDGRTHVVTIAFDNDYSFGLAREFQYIAGYPLGLTVDPRQPLIVSVYAGSEVMNYRVYDNNGDYVGYQATIDSAGHIVIPTTMLAGARRVVFSGGGDAMTIQVKDTCARYALYYVNPFGGWSSIIVNGECHIKDDIARTTMRSVYNNDDITARGKKNIANIITRHMTLNSGWLDNNQAKAMVHVLESTNVYLFDMEQQTMQPVVITNSDAQYKTYKSLGGKLVQYEVNVEFSQDKIIR